MAKRGRKPKKATKQLGLFGVPVETTNKIGNNLKEGGLIVASAFAGGVIGAGIGRPSLLASIPILAIGIYKGNKYVTAAGIGLFLSNGFQSKSQEDTQTNGIDEEVDGFDMEQVKNRVGNYFKSFSEKLYLPKAKEETATNGLGEAPTYFINPYNTQIEGPGDVDMSQLDRVQQEIANMGSASGVSDIGRTGTMGNPDRIL